MLKEVNKYADDQAGTSLLTREQLKEIEGRWPKITIKQLEQIALWGDQDPETFRGAAKKYPLLKDKDFQKKIWKDLTYFEEHAVTCMALERALEACRKLSSERPANEEALFADLASALEINLKTLGEDHQLSYLQMLIFARRSKIIPRHDQLEDLQKLSKGSCVLQKIMGGGKTAVIAALWAFRQARFTKQLPTLFAEGSLYRSLADNLKKGQHTALGQEVFTIDCARTEFDLQNLQCILADLEEGQRKKWILVMRVEMLQSLDLELQKLTMENCGKDQGKRKVLRTILHFFKTQVNALGDEIDLLLRADFEVNVPTGGKTSLTASRIDLVREIFTHLALSKELGIQEGAQGLRSEKELRDIFKGLANALVNYSGLCLRNATPAVKDAFCAFMVVKEKDDLIPQPLEEYVLLLKNSEGEKDCEASELIPLARHIVTEILPNIFKQSPGVHFGRTNQVASPGKIVPYIGVSTPSNREFGYHYEALCKHFFTAIIQKIDPCQLSHIFDRFISEAKKELVVSRCTFQTTEAAKAFKELTGQELGQFRIDRDFDSVIKYLQADISKLLRIEAETALTYVGFYPEYYHSSAQALPNLVASPLKGMTGTPWNSDGYHPDLQQISSDLGAEGQVLYTLLEREKKTRIHTVQGLQLKKLMHELKEMESFPDAILDMGALFKEHSIEKVACAYLQAALNKSGVRKKAVLFFHRRPGEQAADRLAVGRLIGDRWEVEFLTNTSEKALEEKGLHPDQCLVFFDQRHTTGVDIPLPVQAHSVITASETVETRTLLQTVMRLRKFCSSQTADFLLHQDFFDQLRQENTQININDLLHLACKNLARKKAESLFHSFKQQIDEVFIEKYRQHMRTSDVTPEITKIYEPLIKTKTCDQPYQQFFTNYEMKNPIDILKNYRQQRLDIFEKQRQAQNKGRTLAQEFKELQNLTSKVIERAQNKKNKLATLLSDRQNLQGTEVEVEMQQEQEVEIEQEQEIEQELINELQRYQHRPETRRAQHQHWWDENNPQTSIQQFIEAIRNQDRAPLGGLLSASAVLKKVPYSSGRCFDQIFPVNVKLTAAMQRSYKTFLPIFHASQKIGESILVVENGKDLTFVILSSPEASFFLKNDLEIEGVWLVNSSGKPYKDTRFTLDLSEREDICEGLVMANLFLGRAAAIQDIPDGKIYAQIWIEGILGKESDRKDYLTLRSLNRPAIDQFNCFTHNLNSHTVQGALHAQPLSKDDIQNLTDRKKIFLLRQDQIQYIVPEQVPFIQNKLVPFLTRPELIQAVPIDKLAFLTKEQMQDLSRDQVFTLKESSQIHDLPQKVMEQLTFKDVSNNRGLSKHLTCQQIQWVKQTSTDVKLSLEDWRREDVQYKEKWSIFLCKKDIQLLESNEIVHVYHPILQYLTKTQVRQLDGIQVKRLPPGKVIQLLENRQIRYLEKPEQIESVVPDQVVLLSIQQMEYLKGQQQVEKVPVIKTAIALNINHFKDTHLLQRITFLVSRILGIFVLIKIALIVHDFLRTHLWCKSSPLHTCDALS